MMGVGNILLVVLGAGLMLRGCLPGQCDQIDG